MEVLKTFRHENKYRIDKNNMYNIRDKLSKVLQVDRNIDGYTVRSLYFDSVNDIDYYDKLAGACNRKKIRLRLYDNNKDLIKLELKAKYDVHQIGGGLDMREEHNPIVYNFLKSKGRLNNPYLTEAEEKALRM